VKPREPESTAFRVTRLDGLIALACFLGGLVLYVRTLAPGLLPDDSAEYQTQAFMLGIAHPTGYPVYILLAKLFTLLVPIREIAYRVNLLSAVSAALALALVYLAGRLLAGWRLAAAAGVIVLGTQGVFWSQAIIAETYPLSAAWIAAELVLLLRWKQNGDWKLLFAAGLLGGLSLGVHGMIPLIAPAVLIYLLLTARRRRDWLGALGGATLGLALWLAAYLALDALNSPSTYFNASTRTALSVWGIPPQGFDSPFERLAFLLSARQFHFLMFTHPGAPRNIAGMYLGYLDWKIVALAVIGLARLFTRSWKIAALLLLAWACQMVFVLNYDLWDIYTFFVPTYVTLMLAFIAGLGFVMEAASWLLARLRLGKYRLPLTNLAGLVLVTALIYTLLPMAAGSLQAGYPLVLDRMRLKYYPYNMRTPQLPHVLAESVVDRIEDNAIVFTDWNLLYGLYYVAYVEEGRTGMAFHETFPQDGVTRLAQTTREYIDANLGRRPIYTTTYSPEFLRYYQLRPAGSMPTLYRLEARP
jgi:hypothetical protein